MAKELDVIERDGFEIAEPFKDDLQAEAQNPNYYDEIIDFGGDGFEPSEAGQDGTPVEIFLYGDRETIPEVFTMGDVEWAAGKIVSAKREKKELDDRYESMACEISGKISWFEDRYKERLASWTADQIRGKMHGSKEVRSVRTLSGTLIMSHAGDSIEIDETHPDWIKWFKDHLPVDVLSAWDLLEKYTQLYPEETSVYSANNVKYAIRPRKNKLKELMSHAPAEDDPLRVVETETGEYLAFATYVKPFDRFSIK